VSYDFIRAMLSECVASARAGSIHTQQQGGALKIFFIRLCMLRKGGGSAIFVDDGDERPSIKQTLQ